MTEQSNREKEIFEHALDLASAEERRRYVEAACRDDMLLQARVEALLRADEVGEEFLPEHPKDPPRIITEKPGDAIGRYKLLQQIGEGGCGVVYMAEQAEPVRRRVALKIIKLGMDTKSVIARFEAERQALALMDHPNIAKVFDAGATDTGRPYFVMELVRGIRITDYCDQNNLSTEDRLKLFTQVCHAIQHAHQKGVIHRDIKPSNILVTVNDAVPVPKIIDFGIAKATNQQPLTDKTLFTAFEQFIGTPAYMSPEQAVMTSLDIDTRSDIYSLGVLLYELLTGQTPFDASELLKAGLDELRRTIREQEPPKPSTRLSTMLEGDLTTTAKHRQSEAPKLIYLLRGDLDWIVMKALEKDRTRRYETATSLAGDVQRYLDNEPIAARPPSRLYLLQKLVRRNKLAFATATAFAGLLLIGVTVSTFQAIRATRAEREQARLREIAEIKEKKTRQVAQFLKDMLQGVGLDDTAAIEALDTERLQEARDRSPSDDAWMTTTLANLAGILQKNGKLADARRFAEAAVAICNQHPDLHQAQQDRGFNALHSVLMALGDTSSVETVAAQLLRNARTTLSSDNPWLILPLCHHAYALCQNNKAAQARPLAEEAVAICQAHVSQTEPWVQDRAFDALRAVLTALNETAKIEPAAKQHLTNLRSKMPAGDPGLVWALHTLGAALRLSGKTAEARPLAEEAVAICQNHADKVWPWDHQRSFDLLRDVLAELGDTAALERLASARQTVAKPKLTAGK